MNKVMNNIIYFKDFLIEKRSDRVMSAKDLLDSDFENNLNFEGKWKEIFGNPTPNFSLAVTGAAFSGKTSFLLEFAYYLASNFGKVIYISTEEYGGKSLQTKLEETIKRSGIKSHDKNGKFLVPENLFFAKGMVDLEPYQFIIIDSVSDVNLDIEDYKELTDIYEDAAFIVVLQQTKSKIFRGTNEWLHEVDIFSEIKNGIVTTTKNRYYEKSMYDYFNDKILKYRNND